MSSSKLLRLILDNDLSDLDITCVIDHHGDVNELAANDVQIFIKASNLIINNQFCLVPKAVASSSCSSPSSIYSNYTADPSSPMRPLEFEQLSNLDALITCRRKSIASIKQFIIKYASPQIKSL